MNFRTIIHIILRQEPLATSLYSSDSVKLRSLFNYYKVKNRATNGIFRGLLRNTALNILFMKYTIKNIS